MFAIQYKADVWPTYSLYRSIGARSVHSATNGEMHLETVHKVYACARIWL